MIDLFNFTGANFSRDRKYRYALWRIWDPEKPKITFIGLNPATANESTDDPTIRRVVNFAHSWNYGGVIMANLFAWVTAYPEELKKVEDPIGENDSILIQIAKDSKDILFCWGSFKEAKERAEVVIKMFPGAIALAINKDGSPKHPLYVAGKTVPFLYQNINL